MRFSNGIRCARRPSGSSPNCERVNRLEKKLLPASVFRLIGISARFPDGLAKEIPLVRRQAGVYDIQWGPLSIRLIVIRELPEADANAILLLFSQTTRQLKFAVGHYRTTNASASGLIDEMIRFYKKEDKPMAVTLADLNRIAKQRMLDEMTMEERLKGVPTEEILKRVPPRVLAKEMLRNSLEREPTRGEVDELLRSLKKKTPHE